MKPRECPKKLYQGEGICAVSKSIFPGKGERASAREQHAELWDVFPHVGKCEISAVEALDSVVGGGIML